MRIVSFDILAVDLPFRRAFGHSAGSRRASDSIFLKCNIDDGTAGFGECLPRVYVTGESRDSAYGLLCDRVLPRLIGMRFESWAEVGAFLDRCDGKAPGEAADVCRDKRHAQLAEVCPRPVRTVPYRLAFSATVLCEYAAHLFGSRTVPSVTRYGVRILGRRLHFPTDKVRQQFSWRPTASFSQGVGLTARWYLSTIEDLRSGPTSGI